MKITSIQNSKIKKLLKFINKSYKSEENLILCEELRLIKRAMQVGFQIQEIYYSSDIMKNEARIFLSEIKDESFKKYDLSSDIFNKIAYKNNPVGIIAIFHYEYPRLVDISEKLKLPAIICESIEKPGNLGAIMRTADGAGFKSIIVLDSKIKLNNPNLIRAATGSNFSLDIFVADHTQLVNYCKEYNLKIVIADPDANTYYYDIDYDDSYLLAVGNEAQGISESLKIIAYQSLKIPMIGIADSLNVNQAATIIMYEILKQKLQKKEIISR